MQFKTSNVSESIISNRGSSNSYLSNSFISNTINLNYSTKLDNTSKQDFSKFLDESSVDNKDFFNQIKEDITCLICHGLIWNPLICTNCEIAYCSECISKWKLINSQCLTRCSNNSIILKPIGRILKNLLDKVIINCQNGCKISLLQYPTHILPCIERNKIVECWCCFEKTKKCNVKTSEEDYLSLIDKVKCYESKLGSLEKDNIIKNEKIKLLEYQLKSTETIMKNFENTNKKFIENSSKKFVEKTINDYYEKTDNRIDSLNKDNSQDKELKSFCDNYIGKMLSKSKY